MLKRVKQISNVGAFRNFKNGGSIPFEKLTFIYGLNTSGKTTLTNIFSSYKDDNPDLINERKSIPKCNEGQKISIGLDKIDSGEGTAQYSQKQWNRNKCNDKFEVFGSDFIHKNLFTGLSVDRENKENLTKFILGEAGVNLAKQIAKGKKSIRDKKKELKTLVPNFVKNTSNSDIKDYLKIDVSSYSEDEIEEEISKLKSEIKKENDLFIEPSRILNIKDVINIEPPENDLPKLLEKVDALLNREYSEISKDAHQKLNQHIEKSFKNKQIAENWIKNGFENSSAGIENCIYCGQPLINAKELIATYHDYFSDAYLKFVKEINDSIQEIKRDISKTRYNCLENIVSKKALIENYKQLMQEEEFNELNIRFQKNVNKIKENELNNEITNYENELIEIFAEKNRKPFDKLKTPEATKLKSSFDNYLNTLNEINSIIDHIKIKVASFKDQYRNTVEIKERIENKQKLLNEKQRIHVRIKEDNACIQYQQAKDNIHQLEKILSNNEKKLSEEQSKYINDFYNKINSFFKRFGSENFKLKKVTNKRGDQPVYSLGVKFHDKEIPESEIECVFSESDRRALGLAVFLSKIELMNETDKNNLILIFDDPMTSFDDNRILSTIGILSELLEKVEQIIILTHYKSFVRSFYERTRNYSFNISFIEILKVKETSILKKSNSKVFIESEYEMVYNKIKSFIEREHEEDIRVDLRRFLENLYIPTFHADKLRKATYDGVQLSNLDSKIEYIFENDPKVKEKFHRLRKMLNSDSHIFTQNNPEDIRNFARNMFDSLYDYSYNLNV